MVRLVWNPTVGYFCGQTQCFERWLSSFKYDVCADNIIVLVSLLSVKGWIRPINGQNYNGFNACTSAEFTDLH